MNSLPSPEKKAVMVQRMFDQIAPTYDRLNRIITFGLDQSWRKRLLKELKIGEKRRILDLAAVLETLQKLHLSMGTIL